MLHLETDNKRPATIKSFAKSLKLIDKYADLDNPEEVKQFTTRRNVANTSKNAIAYAYRQYCKCCKITAKKSPFYKPDPKPIHIPTKEQLNTIIPTPAHSYLENSSLAWKQDSPIEIFNLKVKYVDINQRLIYPTTAKYGATRPPLKISTGLTTIL